MMGRMGPLGILGGGQLGRMTLQAASALGLDVVIAERFPNSPAARLTSQTVVFENGWDDAVALDRLATLAPVVTLENEFVDWRVLQALEERGTRVLPSPSCVAVVQDKLLQKQALARAELPVPLFCEVADPAGLNAAAQKLGWPLMLKARRDGYDGRGNVVVRNSSEVEAAFATLGWPGHALFAEAFVEFERELASLIVRGVDGQVAQYPVVETHQDPTLHICREVLAPADLPDDVAANAAAIARGAVAASSSSCCPTDRSASTSSRREPTTRRTTPLRRAGRRSSTTTCGLYSGYLSAIPACAYPPRRWSISSAPIPARCSTKIWLTRWSNRAHLCTCTANPKTGRVEKWATSLRSAPRLARRSP